MYTSYIEKEKYIKTMRAMKSDNAQMIELMKDKKSIFRRKRKKLLYALLHCDIKTLRSGFKELKLRLLLKKSCINKKEKIPIATNCNENYFFDERIAVYTCIFGDYDSLKEPLVSPDNVDYYIVTDLEVNEESIWKKINIDIWDERIKGLNSAEKNRFFKMHPELLFPQYNYSVYVDGKIKIITDVTECINNIGKYGIALHNHSLRQCVYDELEICKIYKNDKKENLLKMQKKYTEVQMPKNYGLLENCIIARRHNDNQVKKIMNDWWEYYMRYTKRDQLSLPLVLFEHKIKPYEIATLGTDVECNYIFRIAGHRKG